MLYTIVGAIVVLICAYFVYSNIRRRFPKR